MGDLCALDVKRMALRSGEHVSGIPASPLLSNHGQVTKLLWASVSSSENGQNDRNNQPHGCEQVVDAGPSQQLEVCGFSTIFHHRSNGINNRILN